MNRTLALCVAAAFGAGIGPASAEKWTMLEEQEVSINYGKDPLEASLSVTCTARQSEVYVPVASGTKPPAEAPALVVKEGGAKNTIKLAAYVCGRPTACSHRPDGDVATYVARAKGRAMAVRFAEKMMSAEIDAPGAKLSVVRDAAVFKKFAAACRSWK